MKNSKGFSLLELLIVVAIILIIATIAIPSLLRSRQAANESAAVANLRTVNTAQVTYLSSSGGTYGLMADLITAKLLDDTFTATKAGYNYTMVLDATFNDYTVQANPAASNSGRYGYYSTPDAVVRYSTTASLAPTAAQAGRSVQ
jgi:prepilin-type N-terminal cleavage/methylation domain-containing protein